MVKKASTTHRPQLKKKKTCRYLSCRSFCLRFRLAPTGLISVHRSSLWFANRSQWFHPDGRRATVHELTNTLLSERDSAGTKLDVATLSGCPIRPTTSGASKCVDVFSLTGCQRSCSNHVSVRMSQKRFSPLVSCEALHAGSVILKTFVRISVFCLPEWLHVAEEFAKFLRFCVKHTGAGVLQVRVDQVDVGHPPFVCLVVLAAAEGTKRL